MGLQAPFLGVVSALLFGFGGGLSLLDTKWFRFTDSVVSFDVGVMTMASVGALLNVIGVMWIYHLSSDRYDVKSAQSRMDRRGNRKSADAEQRKMHVQAQREAAPSEPIVAADSGGDEATALVGVTNMGNKARLAKAYAGQAGGWLRTTAQRISGSDTGETVRDAASIVAAGGKAFLHLMMGLVAIVVGWTFVLWAANSTVPDNNSMLSIARISVAGLALGCGVSLQVSLSAVGGQRHSRLEILLPLGYLLGWIGLCLLFAFEGEDFASGGFILSRLLGAIVSLVLLVIGRVWLTRFSVGAALYALGWFGMCVAMSLVPETTA